jgi:CRP-like cAMP-binding protein
MLGTSQAIEPGSNGAMIFSSASMLCEPEAPVARQHFLSALEPRGFTVRAERDEEIVAQDDPAVCCYLIVSGCVRMVQLLEDGRRQVGEFLFAGDLFGVDTMGTYDFSAEAVTPVTLRRYTRRDVEALADSDRDVARQLREITCGRLRAGRELVVMLGRKTASERIATFLMQMAARANPDRRAMVELPMSRSDMADYLGLTIETVCRRLTRLRQQQTISLNGTTVTIRDRQALAEAGC